MVYGHTHYDTRFLDHLTPGQQALAWGVFRDPSGATTKELIDALDASDDDKQALHDAFQDAR